MPIYRRACKFSCLLYLLLLLQFQFQIQHSYSALRIVRNSGKHAHQAVSHNYQRVILCATYQKNVKLTIRISSSLFVISSATWLYIFLYCCGDVYPNPGPNSTTSSESFTSSSSTTPNIILDIDIESEIRLFADDCVCYREIKDEEDTMKLQSDIDRLGSWARKWGMRFQPLKCNMMQLTRKRIKKIHASYTFEGTDLENVESIKYI